MPNQEKREDDGKGPNSVSENQDESSANASNEEMKMEAQQAKDRLGRGLKNMYQNVLDEPLPDEMMALLDQLGDLDEKSGKDPSSDE